MFDMLMVYIVPVAWGGGGAKSQEHISEKTYISDIATHVESVGCQGGVIAQDKMFCKKHNIAKYM